MNFSALATLGALDVQPVAQLADLIGQQADVRIEMLLVNQVRRFGRDLLDLDAALARDHQHRFGRGPVEHDAQVQLAGDLAAFLDEDAVDRLALGAGLDRDQRLAEQVLGDLARLVGRADELHAALLRIVLDRPLAAAAGVNLRLHDRQRPAQFLERRRRFVGRRGHLAAEHGHARSCGTALWPDIRGFS